MANFRRPDGDCRAFLDRDLRYFHVIRLNENHVTPGLSDWNDEFSFLGLRDSDFRDGRVLDVGALDGVHSFNAERAGAEHVTAIDVEDPADQDWGWDGPADAFRDRGTIKRNTFEELKAFFDSAVDRKRKTVYAVDPTEDGAFDIIFFYGVLYHLRHPLLAFDRLRAVCRGAILVETHIVNTHPILPSTLFYRDDVLDGAASNWTGPSESCVVSWMRNAGFSTIYKEKGTPTVRQRFIGFVDQPTFRVNEENFEPVDDAYFNRAREAVERQLRGDTDTGGRNPTTRRRSWFGARR